MYFIDNNYSVFCGGQVFGIYLDIVSDPTNAYLTAPLLLDLDRNSQILEFVALSPHPAAITLQVKRG